MEKRKGEKKLYYHGLTEQKKLDMSKLKYLSVLISVIGVALLLVAAQGAQAPLMKVSDVYGNYLMNYAVVRVNGTVTGVPRVSDTGGKLGLTFSVSDGSGTIDVRVYSPLADKMIKEGLVPFPGDNITAEVQLRVRETYTYAMLNYLGGLKFNSKLYEEKPKLVGFLNESMANTYVAVKGIVTEFSNVSSGYLLTLDTGKARVTVLIPRVLLVFNNVSTKVGDTVYAPGIVYLYRGSSPEIIVRNLTDLKITPIEEAPEVPLAEAGLHAGEVIAVSGKLAGISYENGHYALLLTDGTNYLTALMPREVLAKLNPFEAADGSTLKVAGKMGSDGRLVGAYLEVIQPVKTEFKPIGVLTTDMRGSIVAVKGNIDEVDRVGSNLKLVIDDTTGKLDVFIPSATLAELSNKTKENLRKGLGVEVAGYLEEYRGAVEIVVYTKDGIKALGKPISPGEIQLPKVTAGELGEHVGQLVDFTGSLDGLTYENHTYYLVVDGVMASLPREAVMKLNPLEAGTGSQVTVRGVVKSAKLVKGWNLTIEVPVPPVPLRPDEITPDMEGKLVLVAGRVTDVANLSGNLKVSLGPLPVFIPRATAENLSYVPKKGDIAEIGGYVELYRGSPEVVVFNPAAAEKMQVSGPVEGTVSDLENAVQPLLLTVTWDALSYQKPDYLLTVHDHTGSVTLTIDRSLLPNPAKAGTGSELKVVADPLSGSITSLNVTKAVPAKLVKTGSVSLDMEGKTVAVNGTAVKVVNIGKNLKLTVDDGSGAVTVFIPSANVSVKEGQTVYAAGYVEDYRGSPEIVVCNADAVEVYEETGSTGEITVSELSSASGTVNLTVTWDALSYEKGTYYMAVHDSTGSTKLKVPRSALPSAFEAGTGSELKIAYDADKGEVVSITVLNAVPAQKYATGKVSDSLIGETVAVEGTIKDVYTGRSFVKLTIDDGSGELVIFMPKAVAGNLTFEKGQRISVAGYVSEYKGTVEVIPYNPKDIEVR